MSDKSDHRRGQRQADSLMESLVKPALFKRGMTEVRLIREWPLIVGTLLGTVSMPEKITFPKDKRTHGRLTIRTAPGWGPELQHLSPVILEKIAVFFGYRAVESLQIVQDTHLLKWQQPQEAPAPAPSPEQLLRLESLVAEVTDPRLKERLISLGKHILAATPDP